MVILTHSLSIWYLKEKRKEREEEGGGGGGGGREEGNKERSNKKFKKKEKKKGAQSRDRTTNFLLSCAPWISEDFCGGFEDLNFFFLLPKTNVSKAPKDQTCKVYQNLFRCVVVYG